MGDASRGDPDQPASHPATGLDVIIVRDGKIAALYVFLDSLPA
jgi:hypothetical protein